MEKIENPKRFNFFFDLLIDWQPGPWENAQNHATFTSKTSKILCFWALDFNFFFQCD